MLGKEKTENYLKVIHRLQRRNGDVRGIEIAHELGVTRTTVSIAVHELEKEGYVIIKYDCGIQLTAKGMQRAKVVTEKYDFFMDMLRYLRVDPDTAKVDACRMEHSLSEKSFKALQAFFQNHMRAAIKAHILESNEDRG